jgi:DNA-binding NarL/FixJ family response regulator
MAIRLLLVNDQALVRECVRAILEQYPDMEIVGEAEDGPQGCRMAAELHPGVVVIDLVTPLGIEATRRIKSSCPGTAVLFLSEFDDDAFSMLEAGADGYLVKAAAGDELAAAVRAVHAGEPVLSPSLALEVLQRIARLHVSTFASTTDDRLTSTEKEILVLAAQGRAPRDIASSMGLSARSVDNILAKLGASSLMEGLATGLREGWLMVGEQS